VNRIDDAVEGVVGLLKDHLQEHLLIETGWVGFPLEDRFAAPSSQASPTIGEGDEQQAGTWQGDPHKQHPQVDIHFGHRQCSFITVLNADVDMARLAARVL
jgi:hypothetical protein